MYKISGIWLVEKSTILGRDWSRRVQYWPYCTLGFTIALAEQKKQHSISKAGKNRNILIKEDYALEVFSYKISNNWLIISLWLKIAIYFMIFAFGKWWTKIYQVLIKWFLIFWCYFTRPKARKISWQNMGNWHSNFTRNLVITNT